MSPRESIEGECARHGTSRVAARCVAILNGEEIDAATLLMLAGPGAASVLGGAAGGVSGYWPRVWALRGLLYAWDESATSSVVASSSDAAWRVREMCAKVVARHQLDAALEVMTELAIDPVVRVRVAAQRALMRIVELGDST
jgi:hypothetical protein